MNISNFLGTWSGALSENHATRMIIGGLTAVLLLLVFERMSIKPVVVVTPPQLAQSASVAYDHADQSYKESWAVYISTLLGNVTPSNVEFIKDSIGPFLSSRVYQDVIDVLEIQAQDITADNINRRFEIKEIITEGEKIFVFGSSFIKLLDGREDRSDLTFEYVIGIKNYRPSLDFIDTYSSRPRVKRIVENEARRHESRNERENR